MGRILGHIVVAAAVLLCACACSQKAKVIPEKQLEELYIDMFIADQWLRDHNDFQLAADTSLFFDPIFAEHGYTFEDYDATLKYYTARPEVFSELMTRVSDRLSAMGGELVERGNEHAMIIRENRLNEADYRPYGFDPAALPLEFLRIYDSVHTAPPLVDLPETADTSETVKAVLPADGTHKPGVLQVRKELKD